MKQSGAKRKLIKIVGISFVCAVVFVAVLLWPHRNNPTFTAQGTAGSNSTASPTRPAVKCSAPNQSFCTTQINVISLVKDGYFAGIAEQQKPVKITCNGTDEHQLSCAGVANGTKTNALKVEKYGSQIDFMSRNQYIAYFKSYQSQFGPFKFVNDTYRNGIMTMQFTATRSSKMYNLTFGRFNGQWELQLVTVD